MPTLKKTKKDTEIEGDVIARDKENGMNGDGEVGRGGKRGRGARGRKSSRDGSDDHDDEDDYQEDDDDDGDERRRLMPQASPPSCKRTKSNSGTSSSHHTAAVSDSASSPVVNSPLRDRHLNPKGTPAEAGIIHEVYVENFMCHRKLSVKLCRNVNFIHGQNGSGSRRYSPRYRFVSVPERVVRTGLVICGTSLGRRRGRTVPVRNCVSPY
jgi:hypothetical protein